MGKAKAKHGDVASAQRCFLVSLLRFLGIEDGDVFRVLTCSSCDCAEGSPALDGRYQGPSTRCVFGRSSETGGFHRCTRASAQGRLGVSKRKIPCCVGAPVYDRVAVSMTESKQAVRRALSFPRLFPCVLHYCMRVYPTRTARSFAPCCRLIVSSSTHASCVCCIPNKSRDAKTANLVRTARGVRVFAFKFQHVSARSCPCTQNARVCFYLK